MEADKVEEALEQARRAPDFAPALLAALLDDLDLLGQVPPAFYEGSPG